LPAPSAVSATTTKGNLKISAEVDHPLAKRCGAFSVAGSVLDYEIVNPDSADFFALIKRSEITEISLTDCPANPHAIVRSRHQSAPVAPFLQSLNAQADLLSKGIGLIQQQLENLLQAPREELVAQPEPAFIYGAYPKRRPAARAQTSFGSLVQQLQERHK